MCKDTVCRRAVWQERNGERQGGKEMDRGRLEKDIRIRQKERKD